MGRRSAFKKWKGFPHEENRKNHQTQQVKCRQKIKRAKKGHEDLSAGSTLTKSQEPGWFNGKGKGPGGTGQDEEVGHFVGVFSAGGVGEILRAMDQNVGESCSCTAGPKGWV